MAGYLTHELSEALLKLTSNQRQGIARIVEHYYVQNRPLMELFQGDNPICSSALYYRKGKVDPETGKARGVGWHHNKDFTAALKMAARLALQARTGEETQAVKDMVRRARLASSSIVGSMASDAVFSPEAVDRARAGKIVLDIAIKNTEFSDGQEADTGADDDWWKAAEE